jgi:hypothetical protein
MLRSELIRLARLGAQARLTALQNEIAAILMQFPDLQKGRSDQTRTTAPPTGGGDSKPFRQRKKMSAAARRKISVVQKKRWAEWRKKNGKAA